MVRAAPAPGGRGWPRLVRPVFELVLPALADLPRSQPVRAARHCWPSLAAFPTSGATEDSTLGYALGARGILIGALPMLELVDLPETTDKMVRQNARWYKGVLDDVRFLVRHVAVRADARSTSPSSPATSATRSSSGPSPRSSIPVVGFLGWHLAYRFSDHPVLFVLGIAFPSISLGLTIWVGGIVTQDLIESLAPYFPRPVNVARTTLLGEVLGHVPLPDVLAAGHPRRLARAAGAGAHRPVRARQDRSRGRLSRPSGSTAGEIEQIG